MLQVRSENVFGRFLQGSRCIFRFACADDPRESLPLGEIARLGGSYSCDQVLGGFEVEVRLPHENADAFGGLFWAAKADAKVGLGILANEIDVRMGEDFLAQRTRKIPTVSIRQGTVTQAFLGGLLPTLDRFGFENVALPVCLDDLALIDESSWSGNSFVIVLVTVREMQEFVRLEKTAWRRVLKERATRILRIARQRPGAIQTLRKCVLLSSIGDIGRLPWASLMSGEKLMMVPTPSEPDSANIVLWSGSGAASFAFCGGDTSNMRELCAAAEGVWRSIL